MFLPNDYKDPSSVSNYMKFADGQNKIRILTDPLMGWEYWVEENGKRKPERREKFEDVPQEYRNPVDPSDKVKFFWVIGVWNYAESRFQILELTQVSIRKIIENLYKDEAWGDPKEYDITITKSGEGFDTEYTTVPNPPKPFAKEGKLIPLVDLKALMSGEDPFDTTNMDTSLTQEDLDMIAEEVK